MKSTWDRKIGRVAYYFRHFSEELVPKAAFRRRLPEIFRSAARYDAAYLRDRLDYYNQFTEPVAVADFQTDIAHISRAKTIYFYDLMEHARYFPRQLRLNYYFGDRATLVHPQPAIVKSRLIDAKNRNAVLMKLVKFRNFYFPRDPVPFDDKKPVAVWRGGSHNKSRRILVDRHRSTPSCDIGFTHGQYSNGTINFLQPAQQMAYRYIISIEGNDMATNFKWILASNSLCLQPKPSCETWFMEGRLEAGKHYVELREDFEDLEEKIAYYERHRDEAREIVRNANAHVAQFLDEPREQLISLLVLARYFAMTGQLPPDPSVADLVLPR
jgi:hypothetical protein